MAYWDLSTLAYDPDFAQRVTACAATQHAKDPAGWQSDHRWEVAAAPGFADAYASAVAGGVENPGRDTAVIPDPDILSAVQAIGGFN